MGHGTVNCDRNPAFFTSLSVTQYAHSTLSVTKIDTLPTAGSQKYQVALGRGEACPGDLEHSTVPVLCSPLPGTEQKPLPEQLSRIPGSAACFRGTSSGALGRPEAGR